MQRANPADSSSRAARMSAAPTTARPSATATHRRRNGRNDDSWIDLSRPSSSSVSSANDEIIITGLRVGPSQSPPSSPQRRRRVHQPLSSRVIVDSHRPASVATNPAAAAETSSSQEEYEETESEEDRVLTASSTENLAVPSPAPAGPSTHASDADSDSDFDNATALGVPAAAAAASRPIFRPQPNAFSHPPTQLSPHRTHSTNSTLPPQQHRHASLSRRASTNSYRRRGSGGNIMSPEYRADNDAALRASLTTLLSYGAAARGLSKPVDEMGRLGPRHGGADGVVGPGNDPVELRIVPESELAEEEEEEEMATRDAAAMPLTSQKNPSPSSVNNNRGKRSGAAPGRGTTRAAKKRTLTSTVASVSDDGLISPTLLTLVISAGVVVIFSVVGFGAGYVIGREVGRREILDAGINASTSAASEGATSCGREVIVMSGGGGGGGGLRRLRWGGGMMRGSAVA